MMTAASRTRCKCRHCTNLYANFRPFSLLLPLFDEDYPETVRQVFDNNTESVWLIDCLTPANRCVSSNM